jgi:hypothetical protein
MVDSHEPRLCRLKSAVGQVEICPEGGCPFWEPDVPFGARCAIDELDLAARPELAEWLLGIRGKLELAETRAAEDEARRDLYRLLETGDADGG